MGARINVKELLDSLTSDQVAGIVENGAKLGHKHYVYKFHFTLCQVKAIFRELDIKIDKYALNKRKTIKLPGSK